MCHELAHIRGYIYEDEANFIAFLACVESDDVAFQYSGYLSVLNYVANDLYKTRLADPESYAAAREAVRPLQVLQQVLMSSSYRRFHMILKLLRKRLKKH